MLSHSSFSLKHSFYGKKAVVDLNMAIKRGNTGKGIVAHKLKFVMVTKYSQLRLIRPHQNTEFVRYHELTVDFNIGSQWTVSNSSEVIFSELNV